MTTVEATCAGTSACCSASAVPYPTVLLAIGICIASITTTAGSDRSPVTTSSWGFVWSSKENMPTAIAIQKIEANALVNIEMSRLVGIDR